MRITILNQTFYPDVVSSGQHLADLALSLASRGHDVTVITSRRAYDNPEKIFPRREIWRGVRIIRVSATGFGKSSKWRRATDFATFLLSCAWNLVRLPNPDVVMAMTSPPLISFIGAWFSRIRGSQFCYWIMDLNPDEALAAGWLKAGSLPSRMLEKCSRFSLNKAAKIVVLDHFMQRRITEKGIKPEKIEVIPPWSHDEDINFDLEGRLGFRKLHGLEEKFVVMYSGNHSPCHPLATILGAAKKLAQHDELAFLFVGGGSEFAKVKKFAADNSLSNIRCLPYQPLTQLGGALSAADLHLVVMGSPFVGLVHPCKVYNILRIGSPLLYIGPQPSHISEILQQINCDLPCAWAEHGQTDFVAEHIIGMKQEGTQRGQAACGTFAKQFSKSALLPRLVTVLESLATN